MNLDLPIVRTESADTPSPDAPTIRIETVSARNSDVAPSVSGGYRLTIRSDGIRVLGTDARGAAQGVVHLERLMNSREAPFLPAQDQPYTPLFSPRMVHSGWGLDDYPDSQLRLIAHHGMDAILVFACGPNQSAMGPMDFEDLHRRAEAFGLDLYLYSYLKSEIHPDDPNAEAQYENTYGALFDCCPSARGIVLVGESVEFPSRDPHTTGRSCRIPPEDGIPTGKPSPGWWPCEDFPAWLNRVKNVVRRRNPKADIVFWTYNWGWAPEADRLRLIRSLPTDISLLVTFEMFETVRHEDVTHVCVDYTLSFEGPGRYFESEARAAKERGLRLYAMSNTAGLTWDFGVIPYEPAPFQWARRHAALLRAREQWGLCGLMESHHYGWWPSVVSDLANASFRTPAAEPDAVVAELARRDYGAEAAPGVLEAFRHWSEAIRLYIPTNEDQYGPFRIGPSYPLEFQPNCSRTFRSKNIRPPDNPDARFGNRIVLTPYQPKDDPRQSPGACRIPVELRALEAQDDRWRQGEAELESAIRRMPEHKREAGEQLLNLGRFIRRCVRTAIHAKRWWQLNQQLMTREDRAGQTETIERMVALLDEERRNVEATIPLVRRDSRLGWEPSMGYMTDESRLRWKLRQLQVVLDEEIPAYLESLQTIR